MIDLVYKTVKPSHLKKIVNHTKNEKPNVPSHLHIFGLNFDKANHCFPTSFCCWEKQVSKTMLPTGMNNFLQPREWWQELGSSFEWWSAWVKMTSLNAFSRNMNTINLKKKFAQCGIYKFERKFNNILESDKTLRSL